MKNESYMLGICYNDYRHVMSVAITGSENDSIRGRCRKCGAPVFGIYIWVEGGLVVVVDEVAI
jgi:hypothetical protein